MSTVADVQFIACPLMVAGLQNYVTSVVDASTFTLGSCTYKGAPPLLTYSVLTTFKSGGGDGRKVVTNIYTKEGFGNLVFFLSPWCGSKLSINVATVNGATATQPLNPLYPAILLNPTFGYCTA